MKYIVCEKPGEFLLKEKEAPIRKSGEALLKITQIGICGTDLHAYSGNQAFFTYPRILGHEIAARVEEIDENTESIVVVIEGHDIDFEGIDQAIKTMGGTIHSVDEVEVEGGTLASSG